MALPLPSRPPAAGAAQRARAKAKTDPKITSIDDGDYEYLQRIRRLNATGWAEDLAGLADWQHERDELIDLLWQARQELYAALGVGPGHDNRDYLTLRWQPICGPTFIALVRTLRSKLYLNRVTGELRELWYEDGTVLAKELGISRATFFRLLHQARESEDAPFYKAFLIRLHRRCYDATWQASRVTSNQYLVAIEDPLTPEDAAWVEARALELHDEHRADGQRSSLRETQNAVSSCDSERSLILSLQRESLEEKDQERGSHRSGFEGDVLPVASVAIGRGDNNGYAGAESREAAVPNIAPDRESKREETGRAAPPAGRVYDIATGEVRAEALPAAAVLSEGALRIAEVEGMIEGVAGDILAQYGDANVASGVHEIAGQLARYEAPAEVMIDLCYLARARVERHRARGGAIRITQAGYYINTARNLVVEAARQRWDVAKLEAADQRNHDRLLAKASGRELREEYSGRQHYSGPDRRDRRRRETW